MKKLYESPSVEKNTLMAAEDLMTVPGVSDNGYGWSDDGPVGAVDPIN